MVVERAPTSFWPRLSERSGIESGMRITSAASPARIGRLATSWANLASNPGPAEARGWRPRTRSALMCGPTIASVADSSVIAASTATTTAIAAIKPMVVTSGMSATASETSAMVTVPPAKMTAPPEVATARAIDSCTSNPSRSPRRWRVTMNSA